MKVSESTATPRKRCRQVCPPSDVENTPDDVAAKPSIRSANHRDDTPVGGELFLFLSGARPPTLRPATTAASPTIMMNPTSPGRPPACSDPRAPMLPMMEHPRRAGQLAQGRGN